MSRRSELEKEIELTQECLDNASPETPQEIVEAWHRQMDSLSFELNNLYDDDELEDS